MERRRQRAGPARRAWNAAKAFIAFLTAPAARPKFAAVGLDYRE